MRISKYIRISTVWHEENIMFRERAEKYSWKCSAVKYINRAFKETIYSDIEIKRTYLQKICMNISCKINAFDSII